MFKLKPFLKWTIWGGRKLNPVYAPERKEEIAEAWVMSCHPKGLSTIAAGEYEGLTLPEAIEKSGIALGEKCPKNAEFPLLIKFIDARDKLSIQVHPDDEYAAAHHNGEKGKTEAWYILDADEGAELLFGLNHEMTEQEFADSIRNDKIADDSRHVPVKKGDVCFIPSKTLHAIGSGILLAEVQQSSDRTYRIFDYNRPQPNGEPRELHIEDAMRVTDKKPVNIDFSPMKPGNPLTLLTKCEYFTMSRLALSGEMKFDAFGQSFVSVIALSGSGKIATSSDSFEFAKGDSFFIGADEAYTLSGEAELLISTL